MPHHPMNQDLIIAGGGIAGLSAGIYARMNGLRASIFEMHNIPGGLCTAWERKGYRFDISMHMLTGSVSGPFHRMWKELGITDAFRFHFHDLISRIQGMGRQLDYTTDRKQMEEQLMAISPSDEKQIRDFVGLVFGPDMMKAATLKPKQMTHFLDSLRVFATVLPMFRTFGKYGDLTIQEFASRFRDPFLKEAIRFFIDAPGWPMTGFPMVTLSGFIRNAVTEAGVPLGGSQKVMDHMAELFGRLGGEIRYKSRVTDVLIENDRAVGIELEDGNTHRADQVIWAADGHSLIFDILKSRYMDDRIRNMYENWLPVRSIVHVMMGVNRDLSDQPHRLIFEAEEPVTIAGKEHRWLAFLHHCFDPSMAPEGKSAAEVWYDTDYDYWEELAKDRSAYKAEKQRIADYTIGALEKRWPGFASQVEVVDVPTPATYNRYTGNWKGSPDGWYVTPQNMREQDPLRRLPGLDGLWMAGQWTAPFTGTVLAALTGRQVIQLICKQEGKKFITSI